MVGFNHFLPIIFIYWMMTWRALILVLIDVGGTAGAGGNGGPQSHRHQLREGALQSAARRRCKKRR
jgi:hypothetical protein